MAHPIVLHQEKAVEVPDTNHPGPPVPEALPRASQAAHIPKAVPIRADQEQAAPIKEVQARDHPDIREHPDHPVAAEVPAKAENNMGRDLLKGRADS